MAVRIAPDVTPPDATPLPTSDSAPAPTATPDAPRAGRPAAVRRWLRRHLWGHIVVLSLPVGVVAGLGAILFSVMLDGANDLMMVRGAGYVMPRPGAEGGAVVWHLPEHPWRLAFLPALGGLLTGLLVYGLAPEAEGHGTDAVVDAFHRRRGVIRKRVPLVKTLASVLTIGSGGSAGREGPIGQIGAGFGSALASWLRASDRERRLLMLAGAGAGIGAVFRAPLGGAIFVAEVLYAEMEFESAALVPTFMAGIVAYTIFCAYTGVWGPIFRVPDLQFNHPGELPLYLALGAACAALGAVYVKVFYGVRDHVFRRLPVSNHLKPMLGGLAVGAIGLFLPQALGMGYGWTQLAIDGHLPLKLAVALVLVKIVTTGLTISSGGSGGVFAPSIVIGGCLGGAAAAAARHFVPSVPIQPAAFVLVGMGAFFAGVAKAPISSLVMVSEMTMGYGLLVPLMLTTAVSYLLTPRKLSIYEKQVMARDDSPAHEGEFARDVLEHVRVRDVMQANAPQAPGAEGAGVAGGSGGRVTTFHPGTPLAEVLDAVVTTAQRVYPIVRDDGTLDGVINVQDVRLFLTERSLPPGLLVANDLRTEPYRRVTADEDLASALRKFYAVEMDELPVVESEESPRLVGLLGRRAVIAAYHDRMYRLVPPDGPTA